MQTYEKIPMLEKYFVQNNTNTGWTLAAHLGLMINEAEALFGPRDQSYAFLGIEFSQECPMIRYPRPGQITIQL